MALKRVIMILAASLEFDRRHNSEIVERLSDNEEVPHVSIFLYRKKQYCNLILSVLADKTIASFRRKE